MFEEVVLELKKEARSFYEEHANIFLTAREDYYQATLDTFSEYYKTLSKKQLDELRFKNRNTLGSIIRELERDKRKSEDWYVFYSFIFFFRILVLIVSILLIFIVNILVAICIAAIYLIILGVSFGGVIFLLKRMIETYKMIGATEAFIQISDYRGMEKLNLEKLI